MTRVITLLSGSGSNLQALIDAKEAGQLGNAELTAVLSDRADAYGLQRALQHNISIVCIPLTRPRHSATRSAWEEQFAAVAAAFQPDLVVLAGFMRVFSPIFLDRFPNRIINQHPALLPDDEGPTYTTSDGSTIPALRGAHVVPDALKAGLHVTGCTIHYVTPKLDAGPVLARREVAIQPDDSEESLHERIKVVERQLLVEVVRQLAS
jgi:phosphoribosylglycinamide formyltransferase-1